jgi:hypothetical protein
VAEPVEASAGNGVGSGLAAEERQWIDVIALGQGVSDAILRADQVRSEKLREAIGVAVADGGEHLAVLLVRLPSTAEMVDVTRWALTAYACPRHPRTVDPSSSR